MNGIRKLSPSAGAEWLIGGVKLLGRAPLALGLLGLIYGVITAAVGLVAERNLAALGVLEIVLVLVGPLLLGGLVYAVREVERTGTTTPGRLLQGVREGRTSRLLAMLVPQIGAGLLCVLLLVVMIGPGELARMAATVQQIQGQTQPDPALMATLPIGRLMLWLLLAFVIAIVSGFFTFVAAPEIMFTDSGAFAAMGRSFRACLRNLLAMIVFFILLVIAIIAFYVVLLIIGVVIKLIAGEVAMQVVMQLLLMIVLMPVMAGAFYVAWQQMLAPGADTTTVPLSSGIEV